MACMLFFINYVYIEQWFPNFFVGAPPLVDFFILEVVLNVGSTYGELEDVWYSF